MPAPLRRLLPSLPVAARSLRWRTALFLPPAAASAPAFELLDLLLHEPPRLGVPFLERGVEAAVGAPAPPFRVCFPATGAEDTFGKRHRESGRIVHFDSVSPPVDDERRKTLQTLLDLARGSSPSDCWDDQRAEDLLRSQSTPEELRSVGATETMIEHVFSRPAERRDVPAGSRGTFTVRVEARFEAAHFLREYRGISEPLHGHSYRVEAELAGRSGGVDADAIAVDFVSARRKLDALAKRLDYTCINDVTPFDSINPTAENVAAWFHRELSAAVADEDAIVTAVTIWEGPVNSVRFEV